MNEVINLLKDAYKTGRQEVVLPNGDTIKRTKQLRHNSCDGCYFSHHRGCYCERGEIWQITR